MMNAAEAPPVLVLFVQGLPLGGRPGQTSLSMGSSFELVSFLNVPGHSLSRLPAAWNLMAGEAWLVSNSCSEIRRFLPQGLYSAESTGGSPVSDFSLQNRDWRGGERNGKCIRLCREGG